DIWNLDQPFGFFSDDELKQKNTLENTRVNLMKTSKAQKQQPSYIRDNSEIQEQQPFFTRDNSEIQEQQPFFTREDSEIQKQQPFSTRDNSEIQEQQPFFIREDSEIQKQQPFFTRDNSEIQEQQPFFTRDNSEIQEQQPFFTRDNSEIQEQQLFYKQYDSSIKEQQLFYTREDSEKTKFSTPRNVYDETKNPFHTENEIVESRWLAFIEAFKREEFLDPQLNILKKVLFVPFATHFSRLYLEKLNVLEKRKEKFGHVLIDLDFMIKHLERFDDHIDDLEEFEVPKFVQSCRPKYLKGIFIKDKNKNKKVRFTDKMEILNQYKRFGHTENDYLESEDEERSVPISEPVEQIEDIEKITKLQTIRESVEEIEDIEKITKLQTIRESVEKQNISDTNQNSETVESKPPNILTKNKHASHSKCKGYINEKILFEALSVLEDSGGLEYLQRFKSFDDIQRQENNSTPSTLKNSSSDDSSDDTIKNFELKTETYDSCQNPFTSENECGVLENTSENECGVLENTFENEHVVFGNISENEHVVLENTFETGCASQRYLQGSPPKSKRERKRHSGADTLNLSRSNEIYR
ncbi:putative coiled-coil protein, partial [Pseudoloma neurophilia]